MLTASLYGTLSFAASGLRRLASTLTTVFRNRKAVSQLAKLDDRTLADIGLTRGNIVSAKIQPIFSDPLAIDPFDQRRRNHARELEALARWPRPMPEQTYAPFKNGQVIATLSQQKTACADC